MAVCAVPNLPPMFSFVRYRFSGALVFVQDLGVIRAHHVPALQRVFLAERREQVPEPIRQIALRFIVHGTHLGRLDNKTTAYRCLFRTAISEPEQIVKEESVRHAFTANSRRTTSPLQPPYQAFDLLMELHGPSWLGSEAVYPVGEETRRARRDIDRPGPA